MKLLAAYVINNIKSMLEYMAPLSRTTDITGTSERLPPNLLPTFIFTLQILYLYVSLVSAQIMQLQ